MPSYSSARFLEEWRYAVKQDFTSPSGEPVKYARDGFRTWGSEKYKIPFPESPNGASVNSDGTLLAIASKDNIHIYDTTNFTEVLVLKGHVSSVDSLGFQPGNPNVLVSASSGYDRPPESPKILFWDIEKEKENPILDPGIISKIADQATETATENLKKADSRLDPSADDLKEIATSIETALSRFVKNQSCTNRKSLFGRLNSSFESRMFSPSGRQLIYLPGQRPSSNGKDVWDVRIYSMETHEDLFILSGHTDALIWTGYSPDETMIATVAWDQSMRIWDAATGEQKYKFETKGQNWTGAFSPNSELFAGTCGVGSVHVYSMKDGSELVEHKPESGRGWMRALSWSADSRVLAVGGGHGAGPGAFFLYDVGEKKVTQQRILSTEACKIEPELRSMMGGFLETQVVQFVDGRKKVVILTTGDGGIETYDLGTWEKWRFARPGIDPESIEEVAEGADEKEEDGQKKKKAVSAGYTMMAWDDEKRGKVWIASMDEDGTRIWDVPMTK